MFIPGVVRGRFGQLPSAVAIWARLCDNVNPGPGMSPGLPPIPGNGLRGDMVFPVDLPEAGSGVRGRERGSIGDSIDRMGASRPEIFFSVFVGFSGGIITSQLVVSV